MRAVLMSLVLLTVSPLYGSDTVSGEDAFTRRLENSRKALAAMRGEVRPAIPVATESSDVALDQKLADAVKIAEERARPHSIRRCWRFVKTALLEAKVISSYPKTVNAKEAAGDLVRNYGFQKLDIENPYDAPVGAVIVYGGRGEGHVEFRTTDGFVSDFASTTPSPRPMTGVFYKPSEDLRRSAPATRRVASSGPIRPLYLGAN